MASARDGRAVKDRMAARVREVRRMYFFKRQNSFAVEWVQAFLRLKLVWQKERKISGKKEIPKNRKPAHKAFKILHNKKKEGGKTMNLVLCGKECAYQKDGCCTRSGSAVPGEGKVDGCCYFEPAKKGGGPKDCR